MSKNNSLVLPSPAVKVTRLPEIAQSLFHQIGEDPNREGLKRTPDRFAKALLELTEGYALTASQVIGEGIFDSESTGPVCVRDVEFFSLCEHHVLPFWGKASVAYLPNDKILGLSKIGRVIDVFAKRLQVQERLTAQIGESIRDAIKPRAVIVSVRAQHMCMMMRGVGKVESSTQSEFLWTEEGVSQNEIDRLIAQIGNSSKV